ncbi:ABC transporter permease [Pseudovibrio sp. Tun.PSC04-5.I4]|uniref:ABC transporter permease n=1 Tax=Pseudovibrio sp. Tun.PSC04-5.I4 TaxID=1798213 RepID=UPI00088A775E|nr:ABC transporter permease [Pseudovibrio sp. Tun.PSC04-5.I4]SDQ16035.1 peptide/nickel transport system permease protein [Pseudovibrio sp. Tun.PSC04-5.I4]
MGMFVVKRVLLMIPTLLAISLVAFLVITLPPGDFIDRMVLEASLDGDYITAVEADGLRKLYGLDKSVMAQYFDWIWKIVVHGDLGRSFSYELPVEELIWGRLGMTTLLSVFSMAFIWTVAIPVGIFSAVRKYSLGDYVATFFGFIGLAVPNFLLALVLMYMSFRYFGQSVGGLFSPDYVNAPWSFARFGDLMSHIWIPMVVLGTAGTASVIRTIRANLLDELHRPYVVTARAKGMPEYWVLTKYPVRHSLNPFVSSLNELFVQIVSGSTIVSIVLGLQTTGPLLLDALRQEDMYLAAALIMFLSFLTVLGTLFSDILLAWLDPRIRRQFNSGGL